MGWIMNNTKMLARGNLINQTIKMNTACGGKKWESISDAQFFTLLFDLASKMQSRTAVVQFRLCKHVASSYKCCYSQRLWPTY